MPELAEEMYCSQQICIPPSFPYLLRQYAKAAIRTQPADLLRWSTAYFRCLALNLPPPVKPRLEYPIPKSHFGLTPGWLKALMYQLQNNLTVTFKVLWDRWIGACLQHQNLIELLCLAGFCDPHAIPWFRFVAICAAHLTENLTQTMILICEILTEEPEGGSSMIPLEVFVDVYRFLAAIDASEPQWLRNLHFTDSLLSLYRESTVLEIKESVTEIEEEVEEESVEEEEVKEVVVVKKPVKALVGVISCPDLADDYKTEKDFELQEPVDAAASKEKGPEMAETKEEVPELEAQETADEDGSTAKKGGARSKSQQEDGKTQEDTRTRTLPEQGDATGESAESILDYMPVRQRDLELLEDLKRLKAAQQGHDFEEGGMGEEEEETQVDQDIEKLKRLLDGPTSSGLFESETFVSEESEKKTVEEEEEPEAERGELIYVEAVPGIGPIVPMDLVEVVVKYMHECSIIQHGMVMPRNVRHYSCPPLEVLKK